jgi:4-hydroxybenzoate polyprenyltransferase
VPSVRPTKESRPGASAAGAGIFLLSSLLVCVGLGLGAGWLLGSPTVGAIIGAVAGIPLSFYMVYRRYRDI